MPTFAFGARGDECGATDVGDSRIRTLGCVDYDPKGNGRSRVGAGDLRVEGLWTVADMSPSTSTSRERLSTRGDVRVRGRPRSG